jgi:hypothetical protein
LLEDGLGEEGEVGVVGVGVGFVDQGFEIIFEDAGPEGALGLGDELEGDADGGAGLVAEFEEVFGFHF